MCDDRADACSTLRGVVPLDLFRGQRWSVPLPLVLDKDLKAVATDGARLDERVFQPTRDGAVRSEERAASLCFVVVSHVEDIRKCCSFRRLSSPRAAPRFVQEVFEKRLPRRLTPPGDVIIYLVPLDSRFHMAAELALWQVKMRTHDLLHPGGGAKVPVGRACGRSTVCGHRAISFQCSCDGRALARQWREPGISSAGSELDCLFESWRRHSYRFGVTVSADSPS